MKTYISNPIYLFLIFVTVGVLNSCSVDKRLHNNGFHIKTRSLSTVSEKSKVDNQKNIAQIEKKEQVQNTITPFALEQNGEDDNEKECDLIISIDGDEYEVLITEVSGERVRYKKCSNPDGPDFLMRRDKIFMIKYKNGDKDVFNRSAPEAKTESSSTTAQKRNEADGAKKEQYHGGTRPQQSGTKEIEPLALMSFFTAVGSIFIFGLIFSGIAVVTGIISISRIEKDDRKGGMFFAILGLIAGAVIFVLMLTIISSL